MSHHNVIIFGRLAADPVQRYTPSGIAVTNFSIPTSRVWTQDDEKKEETTWWRITTWRGLAENCYKFLVKGQDVYIEAQTNPDENGSPRVYEKGDGSWGASYEVTARLVQFGNKSGHTTVMEEEESSEIPF